MIYTEKISLDIQFANTFFRIYDLTLLGKMLEILHIVAQISLLGP